MNITTDTERNSKNNQVVLTMRKKKQKKKKKKQRNLVNLLSNVGKIIISDMWFLSKK